MTNTNDELAGLIRENEAEKPNEYADLPDAHDAQDLVVDFDAHELVFFPLAGLDRRRGLGNPPAHGKDHRHRVDRKSVV